MREFGKTVKANKKPLPRDEAERTGRFVADNTLSASFHVSPTKHKVPQSVRAEMFIGDAPAGKFSQSSRRKNWFNEKAGRRIDTTGEKEGMRVSRFLSQKRRFSL
jgi:hypothetical protein